MRIAIKAPAGPRPNRWLHTLLALFLFLEQLALTRDIAAIALGQNVLAARLDGGAGNDLVADGTLNRHLEQLARNDFLELVAQAAGQAIGLILVNDKRKRVHLVARKQNIELDELGRTVLVELVVERGIALVRLLS